MERNNRKSPELPGRKRISPANALLRAETVEAKQTRILGEKAGSRKPAEVRGVGDARLAA
jgi:hypothetical protein